MVVVVILARIKLWLAAAGTLVLAMMAALIYGWRRGVKRQRSADAQARAADAVQAARSARDTYMDADQAARKVQQTQAARPAPDIDKRDDFDNTFGGK